MRIRLCHQYLKREDGIHSSDLKGKRQDYLDLYQIIIKHNRTWTVHELIFFLISFIIIVMYICNLLSRKRIVLSQAVAGLLLFLFLGVVFGSTVFTRIPGRRQYNLELFWSWKRVLNGDSGLLKENLLNCILLVPMGLLLPIMMNHNIRWWKGMFIGIATSAVIETCQLVFCRGLFEWDDMIHNGVGCMIGCVVMGIWRKHIKRIPRKYIDYSDN